MPRCRKCNQPYTGAFHVNCPGVAATARRDMPGYSDEMPITFIPQSDAPSTPPTQHAGTPTEVMTPAQARGNSPFGTPQRTVPVSRSVPLPRQLPEQHAQLPMRATPAVPTPPVAVPTSSPRRNGHHCTIVARQQTQQRQTLNDTAIAAALGMVLILFAFIGYMACLIILALLIFMLFRFRIFGLTVPLFRLMFPGGQVPAWHFEVFDHDRNASYSVILLDPVGVAPVERSRVVVRGRMRRNYFQATHILRETDANGLPVLGQDGLIARRIPPTWLAMVLLGVGILLNLALWLR